MVRCAPPVSHGGGADERLPEAGRGITCSSAKGNPWILAYVMSLPRKYHLM